MNALSGSVINFGALRAIGDRGRRIAAVVNQSTTTLLLLALLLCPTGALAQHIARDDTHVENPSTSNFGNAERLRVGDGGRYTSFIKFDLSTLPTGTTGANIEKAVLRLFVSEVASEGSFQISRVHGDWNEAGLIFDTSAGIIGNVEMIVPVLAEQRNDYILMDITALVREWVAGSQSNDGIALVPVENTYVQFESKESKGTGHDPGLNIVLTSGDPGSTGVTSVSADAPLSVTNASTTPHISLGIVPATLGGTGLTSSGATGSFLRSDGVTWTSAALLAGDIPAGSGSYIQNATVQQAAANFNIGGTGTAGVLNAATQFNLGGSRVLGQAPFSTFVGFGAGASNTTGSVNTFVGVNAGVQNTTAIRNAFLGALAGSSTTIGGSNSFFGTEAGKLNTAGGLNAFFGDGAGVSNTTGMANTIFGFGAGAGNTTGSNLTVIGMNANVGANNLTFATAIGSGAVVNASNTVVLGRTADTVQVPGAVSVTGTLSANILNAATQFNLGGGRVLGQGPFSTFVGLGAGASNTAGNGNTFVGVNAGAQNTIAIRNTFVGALAGVSTTLGGSNSFFGIEAGKLNTEGGLNAFFGDGAGVSNTIGMGNSIFGFGAGAGNTTGSNNTLIGVSANVAADDLTFATAIGAGAVVSTSNSLVLGTVGALAPNVGIGTTAPKARLDVNGGHILVGSPGQGLILKSPDSASCRLLSIDNAGALVVSPIACP